jgi:L,D-transpeptidase YcbB
MKGKTGGMRRVRIPVALMMMSLAGALSGPPAFAASAQSQDLTAEIRSAAKGGVKKFYAERGFRPLWAVDGRIGPSAAPLLRYLASSDLDGLNPRSFDLDDLREKLDSAKSGDPRAVARADIALSEALGRYVRDMRRPAKVGMTYLDNRLKPKKLKVENILRGAALSRAFGDYVATMGWMSPHYATMRGLLARASESGSGDSDIRRLRLNLDRARILPSAWTHHIIVDAASGRLWYYQAGKQVGMMRVVVGKPTSQTPMLAGMMQYAILNPYWNVPVDLAQTLVAPKVLAGKSVRKMGFEVLSDWSATPARVDPKSVDWPAVAAGDEEIRVRQLPGGNNSMGRVKFMFPNDKGIFLHDTPDRALFAKPARHFSNGCVRLEDAAGLGQWLLGKPLRATASKEPERAVPLAAPVPVYMTYFTATATKDGVGFLKDVYGRD